MKKSITFLLSLSVAMYCNAASANAQGKGQGRTPGPSINQGHGETGSRGSVNTKSGKPAEPTNDHATKTTWETKFNERITSDSAFRTRIVTLLPGGMDPSTAMSGFKNRGQFIAALHVSQNLHIPFDQLKAKMTGIPLPTTTPTSSTTPTEPTTTEPMSLGKAIHELRPTMPLETANAEAERAEKQAIVTEKTSPKT